MGLCGEEFGLALFAFCGLWYWHRGGPAAVDDEFQGGEGDMEGQECTILCRRGGCVGRGCECLVRGL